MMQAVQFKCKKREQMQVWTDVRVVHAVIYHISSRAHRSGCFDTFEEREQLTECECTRNDTIRDGRGEKHVCELREGKLEGPEQGRGHHQSQSKCKCQ
jgi:hypothetical protein